MRKEEPGFGHVSVELPCYLLATDQTCRQQPPHLRLSLQGLDVTAVAEFDGGAERHSELYHEMVEEFGPGAELVAPVADM